MGKRIEDRRKRGQEEKSGICWHGEQLRSRRERQHHVLSFFVS
jgi:hypothetical protein